MKKKVFDNTSTKLLINRSCPLTGKHAPLVDYKNIDLLYNMKSRTIGKRKGSKRRYAKRSIHKKHKRRSVSQLSLAEYSRRQPCYGCFENEA